MEWNNISNDNRFAKKGKRAYLYAFRIHQKYQGKGLGNFLIENVLATLKENGYNEFTVGVEDSNARARYMYKKHGFTEPIARIKESYQGDSYEYDLLLKKEDGLCITQNIAKSIMKKLTM